MTDRQEAINECRRARGRCACGASGSWSVPVFGRSGHRRCAWAGCPWCCGSACGTAVLKQTYDLATIGLKALSRIGQRLDQEPE